ncbi:hypothetical protein ALO_10214 [Acetonema longum DSM 6540]|uniref:Uncharacterized protein n=2 Tax=Acetonema TaxID=2373 RepID=F7NIZ0_9FIRM|nr:hypothetical protein ALO_10214 [Acetonema longum DSM 6540]
MTGKRCGQRMLLCFIGVYVLLLLCSQFSPAMAAGGENPEIADEQEERYRLAVEAIRLGRAGISPLDPIARREELLNNEINLLRDDITSLEFTARLLILGEVLLLILFGLLLHSFLRLRQKQQETEESIFAQREAMRWAAWQDAASGIQPGTGLAEGPKSEEPSPLETPERAAGTTGSPQTG